MRVVWHIYRHWRVCLEHARGRDARCMISGCMRQQHGVNVCRAFIKRRHLLVIAEVELLWPR